MATIHNNACDVQLETWIKHVVRPPIQLYVDTTVNTLARNHGQLQDDTTFLGRSGGFDWTNGRWDDSGDVTGT